MRLLALALLLPSLASAHPDADLTLADRALAARATAVRSLWKRKPAQDPVATIVLYQTNDVHGHIENAAMLASVLGAETKPHAWIDSGDWFQGTPEGNLSRGRAVVEIFNKLHLAAAELGNHEFDFGEPALKDLVSRAHFPVLAANVSGESYTKPYAIIDVDGIKIGVIGLLTPKMPNLAEASNIQGLSFGSPIAAAQAAAAALKSKGVSVIVAATHLGVEEYAGKTYDGIVEGDQALAKAVPDIAVILGGHTHTEMPTPAVVDLGNGRSTVITQTRGMLSSVYKVTLTVDRRTKELLTVNAELVKLDPAVVPADADVAKLVAADQQAVEAEMGKPVGAASAAIEKNGALEAPMAEWECDAMRAYAKTDIAAINIGAVRAGLKAGPLTYRDVYGVEPFEDRIVTVKLSGVALRMLIESALPATAQAPAVVFSGVELSFDPAQPAGKRLVSATVGGAPLEPGSMYTIATTEFAATVHAAFQNVHATVDAVLPDALRDVLAQAVTSGSPIAPPAPGRVKIAP